MTFTIDWLDSEREPQVKPDPKYPNGKDIVSHDVAAGQPSCKIDLPYPARRCGTYIIECESCGIVIAITTAGRPDDPRSITVPCKRKAA